ncbi:M20 family metallopeptidase [Leptotrichia sp. oral taxon 221]|uniref:M20 metallopeptidase family protein n=1 Tax=Leptotrichia sp. oral taxon 221 TaxID=712362 RepID=UPI001B8D67FA|nr:amidohydrolase [Leptotrichia sp. oral taxon 221]QUB98018.1 amidohydrolase [Leptotrichia sp. oral taxon 221]
MNSQELNKFIKENVDKIYDEMLKIRRTIHMNPELGDKEFETSKLIKEFLAKNNIEFFEIINTGVVATIYNDDEKNGKNHTVATRADIDALPIFEENDVEYKSKNLGKMHACGHDTHTTIQLGVAKVLAENKDKWNGTVRFFFQPAEETDGGADRMIKGGALKFEKRSAGNSDFEDKEKNSKGTDRKIDAFFALHMAPEIPTGKIGVKVGKTHACSAQLKATIHGVSAHAALPHKGVDAILIGAKVLEFFQSIVSRRIDPREGAVITIGSFKGGETNNIVCDKVEMLGTIRTLSNETRLFIKETIERDLPIFVESLGGKAEVSIRLGYAPVINNEEMTDFVAGNIVDLLGKDALETIKEARMDVEDVSYFLNEIPGCFFRLGTRNEAKDMVYDLHHPKFNVDEEAIKYGIGLQLKNILEYLNK